jgi:hypothetical protein
MSANRKQKSYQDAVFLADRNNRHQRSSPLAETSHQRNHPYLRIGVRIHVALSGTQVRVPGKLLDVPQRATHHRYFSSGVCDEGPPSRMAGASYKIKVFVSALKKINDRLGRRPQRTLGTNDVRTSVRDSLSIRDERLANFVVEWDVTTGPALARRIVERDDAGDVALRVVRHYPTETRDFARP